MTNCKKLIKYLLTGLLFSAASLASFGNYSQSEGALVQHVDTAYITENIEQLQSLGEKILNLRINCSEDDEQNPYLPLVVGRIAKIYEILVYKCENTTLDDASVHLICNQLRSHKANIESLCDQFPITPNDRLNLARMPSMDLKEELNSIITILGESIRDLQSLVLNDVPTSEKDAVIHDLNDVPTSEEDAVIHDLNDVPTSEEDAVIHDLNDVISMIWSVLFNENDISMVLMASMALKEDLSTIIKVLDEAIWQLPSLVLNDVPTSEDTAATHYLNDAISMIWSVLKSFAS